MQDSAPVIMPLPAMITIGPVREFSHLDCSTVRIKAVLATAERAAAVPHRLRHALVVVVGVPTVHLAHVDGHRAVEVDREQRHLASILKLTDGPDEFLDPADGEGWDQNRAAAVCRLADDAGQVGACIAA